MHGGRTGRQLEPPPSSRLVGTQNNATSHLTDRIIFVLQTLALRERDQVRVGLQSAKQLEYWAELLIRGLLVLAVARKRIEILVHQPFSQKPGAFKRLLSGTRAGMRGATVSVMETGPLKARDSKFHKIS